MYKFTEFWTGMRSVIRLYEDMMKEVCKKYRLTSVEVDIIAFLKNHPHKDTAADIVELRMLSKAAVSKGVDALIQKSLLERNPDTKDRRKIHLKLTQEAKPVMLDIQKVQTNYGELLFNGFSREEYKEYIRLKERMLVNVKTGEERRHDYE